MFRGYPDLCTLKPECRAVEFRAFFTRTRHEEAFDSFIHSYPNTDKLFPCTHQASSPGPYAKPQPSQVSVSLPEARRFCSLLQVADLRSKTPEQRDKLLRPPGFSHPVLQELS